MQSDGAVMPEKTGMEKGAEGISRSLKSEKTILFSPSDKVKICSSERSGKGPKGRRNRPLTSANGPVIKTGVRRLGERT